MMPSAAMGMDTAGAAPAPTRISVSGSMTIYEAAAQKHELLAALAAAQALELDLRAVDEADTAGLQLLLLLGREAARGGKAVRVVGLSPALAEVLERYGLGAALTELPSGAPISAAAEGKP